MSTAAGAMRTHGMRPSLSHGEMPSYATRAFVKLRDEWYRKLEAEGFEIDEVGFAPARERRRKGPQGADVDRYRIGGEADAETMERVNAAHFGGPRVVWDLDNAEYWRLMAEHVEALPALYLGKAFLRRWAEIGDISTAASETGVSRWRARQIHERFVLLLKRKRVLQ